MSLLSDIRNNYTKEIFLSDFIAAVSVLILLIPQGLAYALLAGFPPIAGLYAGLAALFIYPLFASSKKLSVGPVALTSIILYSGLHVFAEPFTVEFIRMGLIVGLMAGLIQILLASFKLGIIVNFLSNPVISGFISAVAIIISLNQLQSLLGLTQSPKVMIRSLIGGEQVEFGFNMITTIMGLIALGVIFSLKAWNRKIPSALIVVLIGTVVTYFVRLDIEGVSVIGGLKRGLPAYFPISTTFEEVLRLLPLAFVIALVSFIDSTALAKKLVAETQDHRVRPNKELYGLGFAKVVGAFFFAIPSSASFGRSMVNNDAGAKTQVSSLLAGVLLVLVLLFLTPLFYFTPKTVLAAIIIAATIKLVDIKTMKKVWKDDKRDFYAMIACFLATLFVGIQEGILAGVVISIGLILWKTMRPHVAVLGKLEAQNVYRNINRYLETYVDEEIIIMRYDDDLYFANADYFYDKIIREVRSKPMTKFLVLDVSSISHVDTTGFDVLHLLSKTLNSSDITICFAGMKGPVRDRFERRGFTDIIDSTRMFFSIEQAVKYCKDCA